MTVLTLNFDPNLSKSQQWHVTQMMNIGDKLHAYFSRNHSERNERTDKTRVITDPMEPRPLRSAYSNAIWWIQMHCFHYCRYLIILMHTAMMSSGHVMSSCDKSSILATPLSYRIPIVNELLSPVVSEYLASTTRVHDVWHRRIKCNPGSHPSPTAGEICPGRGNDNTDITEQKHKNSWHDSRVNASVAHAFTKFSIRYTVTSPRFKVIRQGHTSQQRQNVLDTEFPLPQITATNQA